MRLTVGELNAWKSRVLVSEQRAGGKDLTLRRAFNKYIHTLLSGGGGTYDQAWLQEPRLKLRYITPDELEQLCTDLNAPSTTLTSLDLSHANIASHANIGSNGVKRIGIMLSSNTTLTTLNLAFNELGGNDTDFYQELKGLGGHDTDFYHGRLDSYQTEKKEYGRGFMYFAFVGLMFNTTLTHLYLGYNSLDDGDVSTLALALEHTPKNQSSNLKSLDLSSNFLGKDSLSSLLDKLKKNTIKLETLVLRGNFPDCLSVADMLKLNQKLTSLDLSKCGIMENGAILLAEALERNNTLKSLYLSRNKICSESLLVEKDQLQGRSFNKYEKVQYNGQTFIVKQEEDSDGKVEVQNMSGVISLAKALEVNTALKLLDLSYNSIDTPGLGTLFPALNKNSTLETLLLHNNKVRLSNLTWFKKYKVQGRVIFDDPYPSDPWEAFVEDKTEDIYYYNEITKETSWAPPKHWDEVKKYEETQKTKYLDAASQKKYEEIHAAYSSS